MQQMIMNLDDEQQRSVVILGDGLTVLCSSASDSDEASEYDQGNTLDDVFENIVGVIPDTGKTLEEYREERITERYGTVD